MNVEWNELPETHELVGGPFHGTRVVMHHPRSMHFEILHGADGPEVAAYKRTCSGGEGRQTWHYVFDPERSRRTRAGEHSR